MSSRKKPAPEPLWCDHCRSEVHATILRTCARVATGRCPANEPMIEHVSRWKAAQADLILAGEAIRNQRMFTCAPAK